MVPGVWLRAYAAGYVRKNAELTFTGPYAYTRNPLYLGSMMIAFGFAAAAGSWVILIALAALFAVDLYSYDSERRRLSAGALCGFRCVCGEGASAAAAFDAGVVSGGARMPAGAGSPGSSGGTTASTMLLWVPARSILALAVRLFLITTG